MKWEFPGGKIREGESAEDCIVREIREELGLEIEADAVLPSHIHHYEHVSIELIPFLCRLAGGKLEIAEHVAVKWLRPENLGDLDWAEADVAVMDAVQKLKGIL